MTPATDRSVPAARSRETGRPTDPRVDPRAPGTGRRPPERTRIRCLAVDYSGTLADPGPVLTGTLVAAAVGADAPEAFAAAFDAEARAHRSRGRRTDIATVIAGAARELDFRLPASPAVITEELWSLWPDSPVRPDAAEALHTLHAAGYAIVLACNTRRPVPVRRRTLAAAGVLSCFRSLVLSSSIGHAKPAPPFYQHVLQSAGQPAAAVLFVGDTFAKDVETPRAHGMPAVWVAPDRAASAGADPGVPVISRFAELPALLEEHHRDRLIAP
ncbi:HAD family hydrolase [Streptomyces niphimycinicus]|uniref:HAD family hydrolase n=1 Tax=Streptomyces niphimycinicus TaxID=2842201 RepID=UPI00263B28FF|nr:HAD family hydrolase [Streptomyces niphimycinicus]